MKCDGCGSEMIVEEADDFVLDKTGEPLGLVDYFRCMNCSHKFIIANGEILGVIDPTQQSMTTSDDCINLEVDQPFRKEEKE